MTSTGWKSAHCISRYSANRVLAAKDIPSAATRVFNAGVTKYRGRYVTAFRHDHGGRPGHDEFAGASSGEVRIHYGAADTVESLAAAPVDDLVARCTPTTK